MSGFNPWIDAAIISVFMFICVAGWYGEVKWNQYKKSKLRGATRV